MKNIIVLYDFESDRASLSGGDWLPALPAANMQDGRLHRIARSASADVADTQIAVALLAPAIPLAVALVATNISAAGRWRIRGFSDAGHAVTVYDSDWIDAAARVPFGTIAYGLAGLYDGISADSVDDERGRLLLHVLDLDAPAQYWLVEIDDAANSAGYIDIGRLVISSGFQPSINYAYGGALNFIDNTISARTLSGGDMYWHRMAPRSMRFAIENLPETELFGRGYSLMRRAGFDGQVFVIPDPELTDDTRERRSYLGTIRAMDGLAQAAYLRGNLGFEIKEVIL